MCIRDRWVPYHTTDPKKAKPFIQPTMAEDSYQKGEVCILSLIHI